MTPTSAWLFFRAIRWMAWIVFFGWSLYFWIDRAPHLNSFLQLHRFTEVVWFGSAVAAIFSGYLEMMMRERAGLQRPHFGELIPPPQSASTSGPSPGGVR
jgi:hypothetical protein